MTMMYLCHDAACQTMQALRMHSWATSDSAWAWELEHALRQCSSVTASEASPAAAPSGLSAATVRHATLMSSSMSQAASYTPTIGP